MRLLDEIATFVPGKKEQLAAKKISKKYKKQREVNAKKQKNKTFLIDDRTYQQLKDDDFISFAPKNKTSSFIDDGTYQELKDDDFIALESNEEVKEITDVHKKQKQKQKIETINEIQKLILVNLKIYFRERAYSMPQIKFLTLMNLKNTRKRPLNILINLMKKI